jgi:FkbM family methyltransferase
LNGDARHILRRVKWFLILFAYQEEVPAQLLRSGQVLKLAMSELLSRHICEANFGPGWRRAFHPAVGQEVFVADFAGSVARLRCPAETTGVWILRHGWSGSVEVTFDNSAAIAVLRSESEDSAFVVPLPARAAEEMEISIRCLADPDHPEGPNELWLFGLEFENLPLPRARSTVISDTTRIVVGDWGKFLVLNTDTVIPTAILNERSWAPHDVEVFKQHITSGDTVIDVGANFGHHSIVFSKLVGPQGLVLSVEAQAIMFQLLCANCAINGAANVKPIRIAASDRAHQVTLYPIDYSGENNFGSLGVNPDPIKYSEGQVGEAVDAQCLDNLVEIHGHQRRVTFIKIDVQAYEKFVLLGLARTLLRHRPVLFFEVSPYWMQRAGYNFREIYSLLASMGYRFKHPDFVDLGRDGVPLESSGSTTEWDVLAIPASAD